MMSPSDVIENVIDILENLPLHSIIVTLNKNTQSPLLDNTRFFMGKETLVITQMFLLVQKAYLHSVLPDLLHL